MAKKKKKKTQECFSKQGNWDAIGDRPATLHPAGCSALIHGVIDQAQRDYMVWPPDCRMRTDAERFFDSAHFERLTGADAEIVLRELEEQYRTKHSKRLTNWEGEI